MPADDYTPTTEQVRRAYVTGMRQAFVASAGEHSDEFDRFLTRVCQTAKAEAWDEGHSWGWSDAQDAHDVRQVMDRADWPLRTPTPYKETDR